MNDKPITPRTTDYSQWYLDIIAAAELADYGPVRGTMIIRPYGYAIWESIQRYLDARFKATGVSNAYFPLFIPEKFLKKEESHVEGFAPEVAMVTHAGGKELEEPLVVRPTSETIIYDAFSKWIHSYRDLPILINQWANVVRWEMRPRLFLRTTEFLWQEGHTVHETAEEADTRARAMLDVYREFAEQYMAIPVIPGAKSESERFAGAYRTYTIEAMMQDGRALQFATSHNLGQNFAKVFDVGFLGRDGTRQYGWQTSWGLSTRTIGGLIMTHSDDKGLVLPPRIASIQAVITAIYGADAAGREAVTERARLVETTLSAVGVRTHLDARDLRPGEKYYEWEKKGVPLRIELGPKDIATGSCMLVRRDTGSKTKTALADLPLVVPALLEEIQKSLYDRAAAYRTARTVSIDHWIEFAPAIEAGSFVMAHWDGTPETEAAIKAETGATVRCIPFDRDTAPGVCIKTGQPSAGRVIFAKAY